MTTTKTPTVPEKLQAILAGAKKYGAALAQEQKLRRESARINGQIADKRTEIARARVAAQEPVEALAGVGALVVGEQDAPAEQELGPSVAELEAQLRDLEADFARHRAAIPRQEKVVRRLGEPLAHKIAEEIRPDLVRLKERAIEACETLVAVSTEMADAMNALASSGLGSAALADQVGPPNRQPVTAWIHQAKKDVGR